MQLPVDRGGGACRRNANGSILLVFGFLVLVRQNSGSDCAGVRFQIGPGHIESKSGRVRISPNRLKNSKIEKLGGAIDVVVAGAIDVRMSAESCRGLVEMLLARCCRDVFGAWSKCCRDFADFFCVRKLFRNRVVPGSACVRICLCQDRFGCRRNFVGILSRCFRDVVGVLSGCRRAVVGVSSRWCRDVVEVLSGCCRGER